MTNDITQNQGLRLAPVAIPLSIDPGNPADSSTGQYVDGTYLSKVPDWHLGESPWKAGKVLRMITRNQLQLHSVCDLGCGAGGVLIELQKSMDPETVFSGFDVSPQAISMAKTRENARLGFKNTDFLESAPPYPDLLLLLDVFEHVRDYLGFLDTLRKRTNWVIFHIPIDMSVLALMRKSKWMLDMRRNYGHLHYFTKQTALATLSESGYKVVDHFFTDDLTIFQTSVPALSKAPARRIYCEIRKLIYLANQDLASALFNSYNLMVLAQGDLGTASGPSRVK